MRERLGLRRRPSGMWMRTLGLLAVLPLALVGCGNERVDDGGRGLFQSPAPQHPDTVAACSGASGPFTWGRADLDGDGRPEPLTFYGAAKEPGDDCFTEDTFLVSWGSGGGDVYFDRDLPVQQRDVRVITLPGRPGQLVLVVQQHPRGGFAAHLTAAVGRETVDVGGAHGLVPFAATDSPGGYVAARCTSAGFDLLEAVPHTPVGIVPAWDVRRTSYRVQGDDLVAGASTEVADNVLDKDLATRYADLVHHSLFANCDAAH